MIDRIIWCTECKRQIASDAPFYVAFLDEKWFYMTSHWKKAKWIPLGPHKEPEADKILALSTISCRFQQSKPLFAVACSYLTQRPSFDTGEESSQTDFRSNV
jgi:hypothetical protein